MIAAHTSSDRRIGKHILLVHLPLQVAYFFTAILISIMLRPLYVRSADFDQYALFFETASETGLDIVAQSRFEPLFSILALATSTLLQSADLTYGILLVLSIYLKINVLHRLAAINGVSRYCLLASAAFLLSRFVPLHDLTQLRASIGSGFALLALTYAGLIKRTGLACVAALFHYSLIIICILYIVAEWSMKYSGRRIFVLFCAFLFSAVIAFTDLRSIAQSAVMNAGGLVAVIELYNETGYGDESVNPISFTILLDGIFITYCMFRIRYLSRTAQTIIGMQIYGYCLFLAMAALPLIAHRTREMIGLFLVLVLYELCKRSKLDRLIAGIFVILNSGAYTYLYFLSPAAIF